tara:strand:+ start:139 stop:588 length:450 start_codon:yes stop_codon:yes gene_type:complete
MPNWRKLIVSGSNASLNSLEVVHATGSFTGSFIGDGSLLTNVVASGSIQSASIAIRANTLSPAATASFSDISTLARAGSGSFSGSFQGDGSNLTGISAGNAVGYSNLITLAADYTTAANSYNSLYGPLTIGSGVNVTITAGSFLKIEDF